MNYEEIIVAKLQFKQLQINPKTGFEPMASALILELTVLRTFTFK